MQDSTRLGCNPLERERGNDWKRSDFLALQMSIAVFTFPPDALCLQHQRLRLSVRRNSHVTVHHGWRRVGRKGNGSSGSKRRRERRFQSQASVQSPPETPVKPYASPESLKSCQSPQTSRRKSCSSFRRCARHFGPHRSPRLRRLDLLPVLDDKVKDNLARFLVSDRDRTDELGGGAADGQTGRERVEGHFLKLVALDEGGKAID